MEINMNKKISTGVAGVFLCNGGSRHSWNKLLKRDFAGDTIAETHPALKRDSDSAYVANLQKTLEEARAQ